jgi:Ca2+-binding RTX toxin-like protein
VLNPNGIGNASEVIGGTDQADKINAGGGNDTVWADGGNDTVEGGLGADFLHGGAGDDVITDIGDNNMIWGDGGNDIVRAGTGLDIIFGGDGNDTLFGGLGADEIDGQDGDDLIYCDNGSVDALGNVGPTGGDDMLNGGAGNDRIFGGGGNDLISGGDGNDTIDGGIGNNLLNGDAGDDLFLNDPSQIGFNNVFIGGLGGDFNTVDYSRSIGVGPGVGATRLGISVDLSNAGVAALPVGINVPDAFTDIQMLIGSAFADTLSGGLGGGPSARKTDAFGNLILDAAGRPVPEDFRINGLAGNDSINGGDGNDSLSGGLDADTLAGGLGNDQFIFNTALGATNVDRVLDFSKVVGNTDTFVLDRAIFRTLDAGTVLTAAEFRSGGGAITANAATQRIIYDTATGNLYYDSDGTGPVAPVRFATAASVPAVGATPVIPALTNTDFTLVGIPPVVPPVVPPAGNVINGTAANDNLVGTAAADVINGLAGNDTINGGAGNDSIDGGDGNDILTGGLGADRFIFSTALNSATNVDTLTDFAQGTDQLALSRGIFAAFGATATTVAVNQFEVVRGTGATLGTTRLFYDRNNQGLFYDPDGSGPLAATRFATTAVRPVNTDFVIF